MRPSAFTNSSNRRLASFAAFVLAVGTAACGDSSIAAPDPAAAVLNGRWELPALAMPPAGRLEYALTFASPDRFTWDIRSFGMYPGQPADELSSYSRLQGTYETNGASLDLTPRRVVTWDRFYGVNSRERREDPSWYADIFDQATFKVEGDELTIDLVTYPADAPEPARVTYFRAP